LKNLVKTIASGSKQLLFSFLDLSFLNLKVWNQTISLSIIL
jgi:hypothetical protein